MVRYKSSPSLFTRSIRHYSRSLRYRRLPRTELGNLQSARRHLPPRPKPQTSGLVESMLSVLCRSVEIPINGIYTESTMPGRSQCRRFFVEQRQRTRSEPLDQAPRDFEAFASTGKFVLVWIRAVKSRTRNVVGGSR